MKLRYVGESFGVDGLTNGKIYECTAYESGMLRIIDDSDEDYLYSVKTITKTHLLNCLRNWNWYKAKKPQ